MLRQECFERMLGSPEIPGKLHDEDNRNPPLRHEGHWELLIELVFKIMKRAQRRIQKHNV
jgi:hypothetical protein